MYIEELKKALYLDERYTVSNLKTEYNMSSTNKGNSDSEDSMLSLLDMISDFETMGLDIKDTEDIQDVFFGFPNSEADVNEKHFHICRYKNRKLKKIRYKKYQIKSVTYQKYVRLINEIGKLCPNESSPISYKIRYQKTVLWVAINFYNLNRYSLKDLNFANLRYIFLLKFELTKFSHIDNIIDIIYKNHVTKNLDDTEKQIRKCRSAIRNELEIYVKKEKMSFEDINLIKFYGQILTFLVAIEKEGTETKQELFEKEGISYLAYFLAEIFFQSSPPNPTSGLQFVKKGLMISNPLNCQDVFNILGLCALDCGKLQLSYDVYYSWINSCIVGELRTLLPPDYQFPSNDVKNNRKATMHNNFAYVCSMISNLYDYKLNNLEWNTFHKSAIDEIEKAIDLNPSMPLYYKNYAIMLCDGKEKSENIFKAIELYSRYKETAIIENDSEEIVTSTRIYSEGIIEYILNKYSIDAEYGKWFQNDTIQEYYLMLNASIIDYMKLGAKGATLQIQLEKDYATRILWKPIFDLQEKFEAYDDVEHIKMLLLLIHRASLNLKKALKRTIYTSKNYYTRIKENDEKFTLLSKENETIAYYTKLSTTQYLFEDLYQDSSEQHPRKAKANEPGKNCLTIMNAKYMNDPHEGLTLLNSLYSITRDSGYERPLFHDYSTEQLRTDIYSNYFIFLKSFTENIDHLIMWNRYASDYNDEGHDSNGCYIQLDPNVFQQLMNPSSSESLSIIKNDDLKDDFALYRVIYVDKYGNALREINPKISDDALIYHSKLKSLFCILNKYLNDNGLRNLIGNKWEGFIDDIRLFLQHSLQFTLFLVKDEAYSEEQESRLILTRSFNQQETIRMTDGIPSKLCINPYFQIYITRIIFGPNVHNTNIWEPYFQYHLNRMWEKHPDYHHKMNKDLSTRYTIDNSKVPYKTN